MGTKEMTNEEERMLEEKYFYKEGYTFPGDIDHRVDQDSLRAVYSHVRKEKPTNVLQIGCWEGGTTLPIMKALIKNGEPFRFIASELLDDKRQITSDNCARHVGIAPGMIGDITKNLDQVPDDIDFLYHDTDHDLDTTVWIFENIFPKLKDGALVIFHDWAVEDKNGVWTGKGENGAGGWPETEYMLELHRQGKLPLEKVFWNFHNPGSWELGIFTYRK